MFNLNGGTFRTLGLGYKHLLPACSRCKDGIRSSPSILTPKTRVSDAYRQKGRLTCGDDNRGDTTIGHHESYERLS
jgi:hypothetical protein